MLEGVIKVCMYVCISTDVNTSITWSRVSQE